MSYRPEARLTSFGLQLVDDQVDGRRGSSVLEKSDDFDCKTATWKAAVVDGSANGELRGNARLRNLRSGARSRSHL